MTSNERLFLSLDNGLTIVFVSFKCHLTVNDVLIIKRRNANACVYITNLYYTEIDNGGNQCRHYNRIHVTLIFNRNSEAARIKRGKKMYYLSMA